MKVIRGKTETVTSYDLQFFFDETGGYGFECDEKGNVLNTDNECAMRNYEWCLNHPEEFEIFNHIVKNTRTIREPDHGICKCGEKVWLTNEYMGACECPNCGQWYNLFGQELVHPKYWDRGYDW